MEEGRRELFELAQIIDGEKEDILTTNGGG